MKATLAAIAVLVLALGWTSEAVQVEVSAGLDIHLCLYNCLYFELRWPELLFSGFSERLHSSAAEQTGILYCCGLQSSAVYFCSIT